MVHLAVPELADYRERITLYFDDRVARAGIPVALPQSPADPPDASARATATRCPAEEIRTGYEEAFVEELKGFWSAIVEGTAGAQHG